MLDGDLAWAIADSLRFEWDDDEQALLAPLVDAAIMRGDHDRLEEFGRPIAEMLWHGLQPLVAEELNERAHRDAFVAEALDDALADLDSAQRAVVSHLPSCNRRRTISPTTPSSSKTVSLPRRLSRLHRGRPGVGAFVGARRPGGRGPGAARRCTVRSWPAERRGAKRCQGTHTPDGRARLGDVAPARSGACRGGRGAVAAAARRPGAASRPQPPARGRRASQATLYVRNLPPDLYDELRRWAAEHDCSVNAEGIDVLRREAERRQGSRDVAASLAAYFDEYGDQPVPVPDVVELINEGRDRAWHQQYGA